MNGLNVNKVKSSLILGIVLFSAVRGNALNWSESKTLLREKNYDYSNAVNQLEQTRLSQKESAASFFPQLDYVAKHEQSNDTLDVYDKYYSSGLVLTQNLFNGGKDYYSYKSSQQKYSVEQQNFRIEKIKLQSELKRQIAQLEYTQKSVALSEAIVVRRKENYESVSLRYGTGYEDKAAVMLSDAYLIDSTLDIEVSKAELDQADKSLKQFLGLPLNEKIAWQGTIPQKNIELVDEKSRAQVDTTIEKLQAEHPLVLQAQSEEKSSYFNKRTEQAGYMPTLDLTAKYTDYDSQLQLEQNKWLVELTLTIPLFSGFSTQTKTKTAELQYEQALKKTLNQSSIVVTQIIKTYANLKLAKSRVVVAEKYLKAAKLRAEYMHEKYNLGLAWFDRWDTAETNLIAREKDYLQAQRDLIVALADFEEAIAYDEEE